MGPLEKYFRELSGGHSLAHEISFYGALQSLIDEIGQTLNPKVKCFINPRNSNSDFPDGGFFNESQVRNTTLDSSSPGLGGPVPERGVLEIKDFEQDVVRIAASRQVTGYWENYGQVLVTNYWDFLVVGTAANGNKANLERYSFAESEAEFWKEASHSRRLAQTHERPFTDYLIRVLLSVTELTEPKTVAWLLASYAKQSMNKLHIAEMTELDTLRSHLEVTLGITFGGREGDHFFRSTLVQTIFYGMFAAWVVWAKTATAFDRFDWKTAVWTLNVPFISTLFETIATKYILNKLGLIMLLDWTGEALNRINVPVFFTKFQEEDAIQYFYEPFLVAFDPELRKQLGVWYTPPEIVKYMVTRIDTILKKELNEPQGLCSENVIILDPCCGTGAYLIEALKLIRRNLEQDSTAGQKTKRAAMRRILGFEILPASFVVAHLQMTLLLADLKCPPFGDNERPGIYLSNALTGWTQAPRQQELEIPQRFKIELQAAREVKQRTKIIVVVGNPPYNAFAGAVSLEEDNLPERYKQGLNEEWGIDKNTLNDLYVRFFRMAEKYVIEGSHKSVLCYISNFSYLHGASFAVMRQSLLENFDKIWIDCLNGDKRETGKKTPDGHPDPSVFSAGSNSGIQVGTAISLMVRKPVRNKESMVFFRHFWGTDKKDELLLSLKAEDVNSRYQLLDPSKKNMYSFRPISILEEYWDWPSVGKISAIDPLPGPIERRGNSLIVFRHQESRFASLEAYLDPDISDREIARIEPRFVQAGGEFKGMSERARLKGRVRFDRRKIVPYVFKPFDVRLAYLDDAIQPLFSRPSPELINIRGIPDNWFIITRDLGDKWNEGAVFYYSSLICDYHCMSGEAKHFPLLTSPPPDSARGEVQPHLFGARYINLSDWIYRYLDSIGLGEVSERDKAELVWMHVLAIGYSPEYLHENLDGIRLLKWPRIPFPTSAAHLRQSAGLGQCVSLFLDLSRGLSPEIPGLKAIGRVSHVNGDGVALDRNRGDFDVGRVWGYLAGSTVMPGQGSINLRDYQEETEQPAIRDISAHTGLSQEEVVRILGMKTVDVFLNNVALIRNIPERVWAYSIGGYQVIKKWLSYRSVAVIQRPLHEDELDEIPTMSRRIASLLLLEPDLDENYERIKENYYDFS